MDTVVSQLNESLQIGIGEMEPRLKSLPAPVLVICKERHWYPAIMFPYSPLKFSTENLEPASFHSSSVAVFGLHAHIWLSERGCVLGRPDVFVHL